MLPMLMMRPVSPRWGSGALDRGEDALHVDRHQPVELLHRQGLDGVDVGDARIVDQDVQPAQLRDGLVDRPGDLLGVAAVGLNRNRRSAVRGDFGGQLLGLGGRRAVGERDGGAVGGQPPDDLRPDAP